MESAPAQAQSRILPCRLSKTVQPAPYKGQRRWIPRFSGQISSADAKNGAKKCVFPKRLLSPRGTRAAGHRVPTHTMLRAALTINWLCVSFRSHRAVFVCEKRTAILTMRRTDVRIEIQKGYCLAVAPIISRDSPAKVCSARRGFLIYRLTDMTSMVNTTRNVRNS